MIIVIVALLHFAAILGVAITAYKTFRTRGGSRIKIILAALYAFGFALFLDVSRGIELADQRGLDGTEPLIFGSWQMPIGYAIFLTVLTLQIYAINKYSKRSK
jgi:hypothetical protein